MTLSTKTCPRCYTLVASGWDDIGLHVTIDLRAMDRQAELHAVIAGKSTFTVTVSGDLMRRDASRLKTAAAAVYANHDCPNARAATDAKELPF